MTDVGAEPGVVSRPQAAGEPPHERVRRALEQRAGSSVTLVVSVPAPVVSPDRALAAVPQVLAEGDAPEGLLWDPPHGPAVVGAGACQVLEAEGERRSTALRARVEALWGRLVRAAGDEAHAPAPRLFGGMAFAPCAAAAPWEGFADASFVLPRWSFGTDGERAWLQLAVDCERLDAAARERRLAELSWWLERLRRAADAPDPPPLARPRRVEHLPSAQWDAQVRAIVRDIHAGWLRKVVAARRCALEHLEPVDARAALARLGRRYPGCTRFAVRRGASTFFGATPERLVEKRGEQVLTEAMAGTVGLGEDAALLASDKDRREHALVVEAVEGALAGACRRVERDAEPRVLELPNVLHLHTPIRGEAREGTHLLDLVDALHPTPAVGGVPRGRALSWIAEHERAARGWYSGPVGWIDANGDGQMVVALRSGLIRGRRAWAWAGAGIVEGSDPAAEYGETALKLRPVLDALGACGPEGGGTAETP